LILSSAGYDDLIPKSLDGYGIPPSQVFTLPAAGTPTKEKRLSYERRGEEPVRQINTPFFFVDRLSKLVVRVGLKTVCITRIGARVWRRRSRCLGMRGRRMGIDHGRVIGG